METFLARLVYELLLHKRAAPKATQQFEALKHDDDLCPKFQRKLEVMLGALEKYHKIAYDIQGLKDEGTDVLLRQPGDKECTYICFQLKSEADIKSRELLKNLKAQWFDTRETYKAELLDYYIVLCCNSNNRPNKMKIRSIEAAFKKVKQVHVIEPEYGLSFLSLATPTIDAVIKSKIGSEDIVFLKSLEIVATLTPTERALLFYLIWRSLYKEEQFANLSDLTKSDFLSWVYNVTPPVDRDQFFEKENDFDNNEDDKEFSLIEKDLESRIARDLDYLFDDLIYQDYTGSYSVDAESVRPIAAIMLDGASRYEYRNDLLLSYMMDVFGPLRGYETPKEAI